MESLSAESLLPKPSRRPHEIDKAVQLREGGEDIRILVAFNRCLTVLNDAVTAEIIEPASSAIPLKTRLVIWSKYAGVTSRPGLRLDDRLRDYEDVRMAIIGLLSTITSVLEGGIPAMGQSTASRAMLTPEGQDMTKESAIHERWRSYQGTPWETVDMSIDMLLEMATCIRKSTIPLTSKHLDTHYTRPDDSYFAEFAKLFVRRRFPSARRSLANHLGDSIHIRRKRLLYQQKHEEKLAYSENSIAVDDQDIHIAARPESASHIVARKSAQARLTVPNSAFRQPPSNTELSKLDKSALYRRIKSRTVISSRASGIGSHSDEEMKYPKRPMPLPDEKWCVCPYCSEPLAAAQMTDVSWRLALSPSSLNLCLIDFRKHVDQDLQPYLCLSEKCQEDLRFFASRDEWSAHMTSFHTHKWAERIHMMTWACDLGHHQEFEIEEDFRSHLDKEHDDISELKQNSLVRRSRALGYREELICPLCENPPREIRPNTTHDDQARTLFTRHVANHLRSLALLSLPTLSAEPCDDVADSSAHVSRQSTSGFNTKSRDDLSNLVEELAGSSPSVAQERARNIEDEIYNSMDPHPRTEADNFEGIRWETLGIPEKDFGDDQTLENLAQWHNNDLDVSNSGLCDTCRLCMQYERRYDGPNLPEIADIWRQEIHHDWSEVEMSARSGCALCNRLLYLRKPHNPPNLADNIPTMDFFYKRAKGESDFTPESVTFKVKNNIRDVPAPVLSLSFVPVAVDDTSFPDLNTNSQELLAGHSGDESCIRLVQRWLKICTCDHSRCNAFITGDQPAYMPARLLDVSNPDLLRIVSTDESSPDAYMTRYSTLSHVWGKSQFLTLREENLDRFRHEGIPISELTENFRDAASMTSRLGLSYLWIDALCIVQDSQEDWERELPIMPWIFRNAYCNLVACGESADGLFFARDPTTITPAFIAFKLRGEKRRMRVQTIEMFNFQLGARVNILGWIFQELLLSRRSIYFAQGQIVWECADMLLNESFPDGSMVDLAPRKINRMVWEGISTGEIHENWLDIVEQFSRCILNRHSDIFPALSGIAEYFQVRPDNRYCAGIWDDDLLSGLLWKEADKPAGLDGFIRPPESESIGKPSALLLYPPLSNSTQAPSWSWASLKPGTGVRFQRFSDYQFDPSGDAVVERMIEEIGGSPYVFGGMTKVILHGYLFKPPESGMDGLARGIRLFVLKRASEPSRIVGLYVQPVDPDDERPYPYYKRVGVFDFSYKQGSAIEGADVVDGKLMTFTRQEIYLI